MAWDLDAVYSPDYYTTDGIFNGWLRRIHREISPDPIRNLFHYGTLEGFLDPESYINPYDYHVDSFDQYSLPSFTNYMTAAELDFWNKLSDSEKKELISTYYSREVENQSGFGKFLYGTDYEVDTSELRNDIQEMLNALAARPVRPDENAYWESAKERAYAERDAALAERDALLEQRVGLFNDELTSLASSYNIARAGTLSQQYQQNAQFMDTLSSQMDKSQRNALEAGASAGLRLAGNINTLLSVQNKQSQTSLETANQLAQMMVSQRNAEASVRGNYGDYLAQDWATRQNIKNSAYGTASKYKDTEYGIANREYNSEMQDWDSANQYNPFWEYRNNSNFNKTGG